MKKQSTLKLSIPKPCHEGWKNMTPTERGRHCASCNKTVVDFTLYSDRELVEFFKKNKGPVCGHIPVYNLNRQITVTEFRKRTLFERLLMGTALASWLGISSTANAQVQHATLQTQNQNPGIIMEGSIVDTKPGVYKPDTVFKVTGRILDTAGKPVPNTTVHIFYHVDTIIHTEYGYDIKEPRNEWRFITPQITIDSSGSYIISLPEELKGKEIEMRYLSVDHLEFTTTITINSPSIAIDVRLHDRDLYVRGDAVAYIVDGMVINGEKLKDPADIIQGPSIDNYIHFPRSNEQGENDVVLPPPSIPMPKNRDRND